MNSGGRHVRKEDMVVMVLCATFLLATLGGVGQAGRQRARESVCCSNVKRLSGAWLKYADEHNGALVGGNTGPGNWVDGTYGPPQQNLDAIRRGMLFPYVGDVRIYRCPAQEAQRDPNQFFCLRSFAVAGGANGETWSDYVKATKYSELKDPATRYVFVEAASPRGFLFGSWQMNPVARTWVDPVAMWHDRKSSLGFADGHAETHAWQDGSFIRWNLTAMYTPLRFTFGLVPPASEQNDFEYMAKGFPRKSLK